MKTKIGEWKSGIKVGIPIAMGYFAVSFTFGILAKQAGLNPFEALLMSVTNLTSAGQFAGLTLIATAAAIIEIAVAQLIINSRYFLMSFALSQKIDPKTPVIHRLLMAYGITDEVFGVSVTVPGKLSPYYAYGVMSVAVPGWALGTLFGVISGDILPPRLISALSIALFGMLLAVIIPPAKKSKVRCRIDCHFYGTKPSICYAANSSIHLIRRKNYYLNDFDCRYCSVCLSGKGEYI